MPDADDATAQSAASPGPAVQGRSSAPKTLLVLGGTRFLGPAVVEAAQAAGMTVTLFNRGKSNPEMFPDVEKLRGDRDPKVGTGLEALKGRSWDAVIDTSGYYPRIVRASAELLEPHVGQYVFVSSVSAYAKHDTPNADETAPVAKLEDPNVETMGDKFQNYGGLKVLCEQAAEATMPGRVANVRPGYIVGPRDGTDRFTYWPWRVKKGGEMLAPGDPNDPIQIIDVRDLGQWLVHLTKTKQNGLFNAVGPAEPTTMGAVLGTAKKVAKADTRLTWVPAEFLERQSKKQPLPLPIWAPPSGETAGFHTYSNARARAAGLRFRPLSEIIADTLAWFESLPEERQTPRAGISEQREAEVLAAFRKRAPARKSRKSPSAAG